MVYIKEMSSSCFGNTEIYLLLRGAGWETEWPASGKTVLNCELYEDGEILVQKNSYQVLNVNSRHNNSLIIDLLCY